MEHDERQLKELYLSARKGEEKAPDFDELLSRSSRSSKKERNRAPLWSLAAMVLLLLAAGVVFSQIPTPVEEFSGESRIRAESVEALEVNGVGMAAREGDEEWEELLEFADSLWEWESPTDFLL